MTYEEFINNILETRGRFACGDEYHERHHIVPKCMGGGNEEENLIDLFAREHFEAHRLLALENPENYKLVAAFSMMAFPKSRNQDRPLTPEEYEEARILFGKLHSGKNHPLFGHTGAAAPMYGKRHTEESKKKIKENHSDISGVNHPMYGKHHSEDTKKKIRENRADLSGEKSPWYGRKHTEETKQKISNKNKGRLSGYKNPNYGKNLSDDVRKKISESLIGKFRAEKSPRSKIVVQYDTDNNIIDVYPCTREVKRMLNIDDRRISACCRNERKTAGGYQWKYLYDQTCKDGTVIQGAISLGLITEEEALKMLKEQSDMKGEKEYDCK